MADTGQEEFTCLWCLAMVVNGLKEHWEICKQQDPDRTWSFEEYQDAVLVQKKVLTDNMVIRAHNLVNINNMDDPDARLMELINYLHDIGHIVIETPNLASSAASSSFDPPATSTQAKVVHQPEDSDEELMDAGEDDQEEATMDLDSPGHPTHNLEGLAHATINLEQQDLEQQAATVTVQSQGSSQGDVRIIGVVKNPKKRRYAEGSIRRQLVDSGLYDQLSWEDHPILKSYKDFLHKEIKSKNNFDRMVSRTSEYLAYSLKEKGTNQVNFQTKKDIMEHLTQDYLESYFGSIQAIDSLSPDTVRGRIRAIRFLIEFLSENVPALSPEAERLATVYGYLDLFGSEIQEKIDDSLIARQLNRSDTFKNEKLGDIWKIFDLETTKKQLAKAKRRLEKSRAKNSRLDKWAFKFLTRYCISIMVLKYGHRPEDAQNLTIKEWRNRKIHAQGQCTLFILKNKLQFLKRKQEMVLEKKDEELFHFYFKYARMRTPPPNADMTFDECLRLPFFISLKTGDKFTNAGKLVRLFQESVGCLKQYKSGEVRQIIQTQAKAAFFREDPETHEAVCILLGHSGLKVAINYYVIHSRKQMRRALKGIMELGRETSSLDTDVHPVGPEDENPQPDDGYPPPEVDNPEPETANPEPHGEDQAMGVGHDESVIHIAPPIVPLSNWENHLKNVKETGQPHAYVHLHHELEDLCDRQDWPFLEKAEFDGRGRGVVTTHDIAAGVIVCNYKGKVSTRAKIDKQLDTLSQARNDPDLSSADREAADKEYNQIGTYRFEFRYGGRMLTVDGSEEDGSLGRLINHTPHSECENVKPKSLSLKTRTRKTRPTLLFRSTKFLKKGSELIYNYGDSYYVNCDWYNKCPAPDCPRKVD